MKFIKFGKATRNENVLKALITFYFPVSL